MENILLGSDIKFKITIESEGFDINENDFSVELYKGGVGAIKTYTKEDLVKTDEGDWLMCVETNKLTVGSYYAVVWTHVPDDDFPDKERTEVSKTPLFTVKKI